MAGEWQQDGAGRKEQGWGKEGLRREEEGRQPPKVSQGSWAGREAVTKETKSVSHQGRGVQCPLGGIRLRVWLVWLGN